MPSLLILVLVGFLWANSSDSTRSQEAFSSLWWSAHGGSLIPVGNLWEPMQASAGFRSGFEFSYDQNWRSYVRVGYAQLQGWTLQDPSDQQWYSIPVHNATGEAGLKRTFESYYGMSLGAGVSLFFARVHLPEDSRAAILVRQSNYFLMDNESEFGWHIQMGSPQIRRGAWSFALQFGYEEAWTLPKHSRFVWIGLGGDWKWF